MAQQIASRLGTTYLSMRLFEQAERYLLQALAAVRGDDREARRAELQVLELLAALYHEANRDPEKLAT